MPTNTAHLRHLIKGVYLRLVTSFLKYLVDMSLFLEPISKLKQGFSLGLNWGGFPPFKLSL